MKYSIIVIILLIPFSSMAKDLCPTNENIEPDMRIPESHYTQKNAELALNKLQGIISKSDNVYEWMTVPNSMKIIEGYILKKDANKSKFNLSQFCTFMKSSVWHD
ncbi:hypothetical protein H4J45_18135 [Colwellia sp. BRX10-6]|uniref:hypothetical protein n=1 Tax=unclassified Colwellia TaxID=196834 RepID=UPI0015F48F08|nr:MULTISPECIES: hypothetical protein [unclassified Colwellia]MBA6385172.1 hypothetical protein [Colwellia sp. BRX10-9]MBA6396004.1 hypothetical protein [Colwellia sp. BRX10-6]